MSEVTNRDLATMPFDEAINAYSPNFEAVLPPGISVDHFRRMVISAVNTNPELRYCDRRTFFNAALKCASDGVLPDGREAVLVPFRTKIKTKDGKEQYIDAVQYMIMIAGIRKRLRNSGEVKSATAEVVYQNDHFHWRMGDEAKIEHEPAGLDEDPGEVRGAYAIIVLTNGEIIREVVRRRDIDRAREMSKAKNGPAWDKWYDQMARKVALRRASKAAPSTSVLHRLEQMLEREEDGFDPAPPPPQPEDFIEQTIEVPQPPPTEEIVTSAEPSPGPSDTGDESALVIELVNIEGEIVSYGDPVEAYAAFEAMLLDAAKTSEGSLEGVWESNDVARAQFGELTPAEVNLPDGHAVTEALQELYESLLPSEPPELPPEPEPPPAPPPEPPAPSKAAAPLVQPPRRRGRPPKIRTEQQQPELPDYIVDVPDPFGPELDPPEPKEDEDVLFPKGNLSTTTYYSRVGTQLRKMLAAQLPPEKFRAFREANKADLREIQSSMGEWWRSVDGLIKRGEGGG